MGAMGPGGRYGPMLRPTRRRLIGGAVLLGGGALLAACGATATPTTSPAFAVTPAAAATVTGVIGVPVTRTLAATPAINDGSATELGRLLELIPQMESLPGRNGLWFADVARQKRNYGYEQITSLEAAQALPGGLTAFSNIVGRLPLPAEAGFDRALDPQWRATLGYDCWQIERTITGGDPPRTWARVEGQFDRAAIEAALLRQGYATVPYQDRTYLSRYLASGTARLS